MTNQSKKNMLLLSGSKAAGNLSDGEKPGLFDFAENWIKDFFAQAIEQKKPILFVPYARPGGMSEEKYFEAVRDRLGKMGIDVIAPPPQGLRKKRCVMSAVFS